MFRTGDIAPSVPGELSERRGARLALSLEAMVITDDIAAKCDGPDQFENFEGGIRAFLAVPKSAVLKEEAKRARKRAKKLA